MKSGVPSGTPLETVEKVALPLFRMDSSLLRAESVRFWQTDSTLAG